MGSIFSFLYPFMGTYGLVFILAEGVRETPSDKNRIIFLYQTVSLPETLKEKSHLTL